MSLHQAHANAEQLAANTYPGSGIIMGFNSLGSGIQQVLWLLGKNEAARRRRLVEGFDGVGKIIRTQVLGPSGQETDSYISMQRGFEDKVRRRGRHDVIGTGNNVSELTGYITTPNWNDRGRCIPFVKAADKMEPEVDGQQLTPRVTGEILLRGGQFGYGLAALQHLPPDGTIVPLRKTPISLALTSSHAPGIGLGVHEYAHDGSPLPAYSSNEPLTLPLQSSIQETAEYYWGLLDPAYRVAVAVKALDASEDVAYHIINALDD